MTSPPFLRSLALVALAVGVVVAGLWVRFGDSVTAALHREVIAGQESEPFYPPADPSVDALLAAARSALLDPAAAPAPVTVGGAEAIILSLYLPKAGERLLPKVAPVEGGDVAAAVRLLLAQVSAAEALPDRLATARLKLDVVLPGRRALPADGGPGGAALDVGLDGLELTADDGRVYRFLPSWSAERSLKRRRLMKEARTAAQKEGGWSARDAKEARLVAFRSRAYVEGVGGAGPARPTARGNLPRPPATAQTVRRAVGLGGDYLTRETSRDGKITYEYQPLSDSTGSGYNILRHAGTAYSMVQVHRLTGDEAIFEAATRAMAYYRERMRQDERHPGEWFVLDGGAGRKRAKLGGAGLGLLAFVEMEKARPGSADYEAMFGLARHLVRMQNADGSFLSFYDWDGQEDTRRQSIFYPGEAILGLVRLHQLTGQRRWLDAAVLGADYLVHDRWVSLGLRLYTPPDAWLIQALEELDRAAPDDARAAYAFEIAESIARHKLMDPATSPPDLLGGDLSGLQSLPSAANSGSFGEALSAAARLEARRSPGASRLRVFAEHNLSMQLRNQFDEGNSWFLPNPARAFGGFRLKPDDHEVRNDYVQHNISGLFGMMQLLDPRAPDIGLVVAPEARAPGLLRAMAEP